MINLLINFVKKIFFNNKNIKKDTHSVLIKYNKPNTYIIINTSRKNKFHEQMDVLWKNKIISRNRLYKLMSREWGDEFHVANLNTVDDFNRAYECLCRVNNIVKREQFIKNVYSNTMVCKAINKPMKRKYKKFK